MQTDEAVNSTATVLSRVALLSGLPARELAALAQVTRADHFARDAAIFNQGDECDRVWLLAEGRVKIVRQEEDGREIILEVISPGEVFGGAVLFLPTHPASARAMTDVRVLSFSSEAYSRLVAAHPEASQKLIRMLGSRLLSMMSARILAGERVERRLAHILLKLAAGAGRAEAEGVLLTIPLARQDLADMAGTTLETAIRTMSRFRAQGWVETRRGGYLLITNIDQLRQQAQAF